VLVPFAVSIDRHCGFMRFFVENVCSSSVSHRCFCAAVVKEYELSQRALGRHFSSQPPTTLTMASHPETKIDCSKVYVKKSSFSNEKTGDFDGAFAAVAFKEGTTEMTVLVCRARRPRIHSSFGLLTLTPKHSAHFTR